MAGSEQRPNDDVEGHIRRYQDPGAVDEDQVGGDVEGHGYRWSQDSQATDEDQASDDTQGHGFRWGQDTEAVDEDQAGGDDTEGHIRF
jgi:hypothetical protein